MVLSPGAFAISYVPYASLIGFVPPPASLLAALAGITALYILATEVMKTWFYRRAM